MVDALHTTSCLHLTADAPKTCPKKESDTDRAAIVQSRRPRSEVSLKQEELVDKYYTSDAFTKVMMRRTPRSPAMTRVKARFSLVVLYPTSRWE
jgi:hypothetical protein